MASTRKKWIVRVVLLLIALGAVYVWNSLPSPRRWEQGFNQLSEGDHISKVTGVLGQPTKIDGCNPARFSHDPELKKRCIKEYSYISFLEEWVYVVDQDGIVIAKWHSVSQ
ncbi:MAG TPA: hypothetical protein VFS90_07645 [Pyrinomonadaceae bacterium]|nr:hypothetical protein [Pyrinomonadaceae bacterium]